MSTGVTWQEFLSAVEDYFGIYGYGAPGFIVVMFVLYVSVKDRHRRL
ncbi:MAG TPA: hypothetical protein VFS10_15200 [Pyrinomonadaceae bacterium]|nr:hypothetical protein [Pyrinomonadaceae bacterium]